MTAVSTGRDLSWELGGLVHRFALIRLSKAVFFRLVLRDSGLPTWDWDSAGQKNGQGLKLRICSGWLQYILQ